MWRLTETDRPVVVLHVCVNLALGKPRQEDGKFEVSYTAGSRPA